MVAAAITDLRRTVNQEVRLDSSDAEAALLGAVLYENEALAYTDDTVRGEHFSEPMLGWLFDKAREMIARGQRAEPISLHEVAQTYGTAYHDLGGMSLLGKLVMDAPPAQNAGEYARIVLDAALRRAAAQACQEGIRAVLADRERPAFDIVADVRVAMEEIERTAAPPESSIISAPDAAAQVLAEMGDLARNGRVRGKMTGLRCIDRRLGGLRPEMLVVIGGRPGMSKTAIARAILHGAAVHNPDDLFVFFGLEMGPKEMMQRELAAISFEMGEGVEYQAMAKGTLTPFDLQVVESAVRRTPPNLLFDNCYALSIEDVRRKVWGLKRRGRLGAIVIDYLQLMNRPTANGRNEASVLAEMTKTLKQIARQSGICIVLLSQLSRAVESRDDKRPQLSDLRESGSIEQDADAVLFPFREYYYLSKAEPKGASDRQEWEMRCADVQRRLDVICAKQRQGPEGTDRQRYMAEYDYIEDEAP